MTLRQISLAFAAGAIAVIAFHQPVLLVLHAAHLTSAAPFQMKPTHPLGVPQMWSLAFWGGLWGIALRALVYSTASRHRLAAGALIGAIAPSIVAWVVVMPIKGQPAGGGWTASTIATALLVNAAWGFGTILLLDLFESTARARAHG
jgi:hypothetical protein